MSRILILAFVALATLTLAGCCGANGVPKANLYWPITFGVDAVSPTQTQTVRVPMTPTYQYVPQAAPAGACATPYSQPVGPLVP
jgi:hypothetical protein